MAGDWIKFETATPDKPEVWAIASALNADPDAVVGKLLRVWGWFDQHTENGNAPSVSKMLLNRLVGVPGFCEEVIKAGWLTDDGKVLSIAKFDRHNGDTAKTRALTAKRVAKHKNKGNADANAEVTPAPLPREDKREDKEITTLPESADSNRCPVNEIIEAFKTSCPSMPRPRIVPDAVRNQISARWRQSPKHQSLEFWQEFFAYCEQNNFLAGRAPGRNGGKPFRASLEWLVNASNFAKVINENYEDATV